MPPTAPETTAHQMFCEMPMLSDRNQAITMKITGAPSVPLRSAASGAAEERARTIKMPATEASKPMLASANGKAIMALCSAAVIAIVEAIAMQAIMEPQ